jgi:hypothetical protein
METSAEVRGITGHAVLRAANAMLRSLGGHEILLFALNALPDETATELGAVDPGVETVTVGPVIVRNLATASAGPRRRVEFLIPASEIAAQVATRNAESAASLMDAALGVAYDGQIYRIEGTAAEQFAGTNYLYRVTASY